MTPAIALPLMAFQQRLLGGSGITISANCLGTVMVARKPTPITAKCTRMIHAALEAGVGQECTSRHWVGHDNLSRMTLPPSVNLSDALASFDEIYSPRIVARMNDYDVRIAHTRGEHVWHVHENTDEFFLVLDGRFDVSVRDSDGHETTVALSRGDIFVVPKGTEHKPSSPGGSILMFEPAGTSSTGDRHEGDIPDYVDSTTGRSL